MANDRLSRRSFFKTAGSVAATAVGMSAASYGRIAGANERIRLGFVGIGGMSRTHLGNVITMADAEVVALCDVFGENLDIAASIAPSADTYPDFRQVVERTDIDAVVVGTPDHWHAPVTVMACNSGKDVYVEKPTSLTVSEGWEMVRAARKNNRVVQVGTQQRTAPLYQRVVEIVQSGMLGSITWVRTWNVSHSDRSGMGRPADTQPPSNLDWDLWLGPAPAHPFNQNRLRSWRRFWDHGGGLMTDWGVHHFDIVFWAMDVSFPVSVSASGGRFHFDDNRETPDTLLATYEYPGFICTYESRYNNAMGPLDKTYGIIFYGENATLFVDRRELLVIPQQDSDVAPLQERGNGDCHADHLRHFLDCVRSRERPNCDIETGHISSAVSMLGNIAYRTDRKLRWNRATGAFENDQEANSMLQHRYRGSWRL